jgi:hypothetical protein
MAVIDDLVSSGLSGTQATEVIAVGAGTGSDAALVSQGFSTTQATQILAAKEGDATADELVQQGLFGTQATAIMEAVGSGPTPSTPVTYTQGTEYSIGGLQISGGMLVFDMTATGSSWSDTAAFNTLKAQPVGTSCVVTRSGMQYTGVINASWAYVAGVASTTIDFSGGTAPPGGPPANITAITFTPA